MDIRVVNTLNTVSNHYGVSIDDLKSRDRAAIICQARVHAFIILRDVFKFKYKDIGLVFNRNHSNVLQLINIHRSKFQNTTLKINPKKDTKVNHIKIQVNKPQRTKKKLVYSLLEERKRLINTLNCIDNLIELYKK